MPAPTENAPTRFSVFAHLTAEKSPLYRRVLQAFVEAKASFTLHLRPSDVRASLENGAMDDPGDLEAELSKLCEWGNLEANRDHTDVATAEDFYRPRFLYQLTAAGEAAEQALLVFQETLDQPGELQTTALKEIREHVADLVKLAQAPTLDEGRIDLVLRNLTGRFERLTQRAQVFLRTLQRTIDLQGTTIDRFLEYKQNLIEHLERFIGELVIATHEIAEGLQAIERAGSDPLLEIAARREVIDALEHEKAARLEESRKLWQVRWAGFRGWFVSSADRPSQAEMLRSRARAAIPALLGAVARINDLRINRSDRVADLQMLARWFSQAQSDEDAHRLWRSAFALTPSRHLKVDPETLDEREQNPIAAQSSWLEAPPVEMSPRIRKFGRHTAKGTARKVVDRSQEKEMLARLVREEVLQVAKAQARLAVGKRMRLSELGRLENPAEFTLFLDLLGRALSSKSHAEELVSAYSSDGALHIELEPAGDGRQVSLETCQGEFIGEDHFITIAKAYA